jgi:AcrR family transcriptional regulator
MNAPRCAIWPGRGIQSGSIFHHFKSKDEILRAVMEETIRYNTALMRAALAEAATCASGCWR